MLVIRQLEVTKLQGAVPVITVARVDLEVRAGEGVVVVGGADCGKRELLLAPLALPRTATRVAGSVRYHEQELLGASTRVLNTIRGNRIALIPRDARAALDAHRSVGQQLLEVLRSHRKMRVRAGLEQVSAALRAVHLAEPEACMHRLVRELSPVACQRVAVAMALLCEPELLLLDEPTAELDVTARCDLLLLLRELRERGVAMLVTTTDLAVAAALADRVAVMYGGRVIEQGSAAAIFEHPRHPYTLELLSLQGSLTPVSADRELAGAAQAPVTIEVGRGCAYAPYCARRLPECITSLPVLTGTEQHVSACWHAMDATEAIPTAAELESPVKPQQLADATVLPEWVLEVADLAACDARGFEALHGVSFAIGKGETLGVVGESGSGAALLPQVLLQLVAASGGVVQFHDENLRDLTSHELRMQRQFLQGIGPNPLVSIDPLLPMLDVIEEPLRIFRPQVPQIERRESVYSMLRAVGLQPRHLTRFAHELNREEALRVVLARALILKPDVLVCAEPWAGLDSGARAACSQLLLELRAALRLTMLIAVRDWRELRGGCERVLVLHAGRVVEAGVCEEVYSAPKHPYTRALLDATPVDPLRPCRRRATAPSSVALSLRAPTTGCPFREQCAYAIERCALEAPLLHAVGSGLVACHRAEELQL